MGTTTVIRRVAEPTPGHRGRPEHPAPLPGVAGAPSAQGGQRGSSIYDVARAAGVAPSTVSRAFSRPGRVNSRTAERVFAAAARRRLPLRGPPRANRPAHPQPRRRRHRHHEPVLLGDHPWRPRGGRASRATRSCCRTPGGRPARARLDRARDERRRGRPARPARGCRTTRSGCWPSRNRWSCSTAGYPRCRASSPTTPAVCVGRSNISPSSATRRVTYVAGPEASWADGMRWVALIGGLPRAGPAVPSRRTVQHPDGPRRVRHRAGGARARSRRR